MRSIKLMVALAAATLGAAVPAFAGKVSNNVVTIEVNPKKTNFPHAINSPFVSVTICSPGGTRKSDCVTIGDILVDTGAIGLRIFNQPAGFTQPINADLLRFARLPDGNGAAIIECQTLSSGRSLWGPVVSADLTIGGEKAANIPMQLIEADYAGAIELGVCPNQIL